MIPLVGQAVSWDAVSDYDRILPIDLNEEMQTSYIDYAMSVIVGRALPEVRDGLKPVHRRILYAMFDNGYRPERSYVKSAKPVADTMGNYHPHGDSAIYDTLVRMAQPWSMRYPLVDGQGNFGSRGNDGPAAMRYTESRLTPLAMEMVRDIRENTVDFAPNYDGKTTEPTVLPSRVPNLLMNGSGGIAVGMATNIPPHNLRELADAIIWMLDNPDADEAAGLEACMEYIKGPDFPTAGLIVGDQGIKDAYTTGRGSIRMRGVTSIEEEGNRQTIVITELPYQVNPDNMISNIAEQVNQGKLVGISKIEDESSDRVGMRIVVTLKRDAVPRVVLNNLYKHTQLQENFSANMLAIVDGVPRTLSLDAFVRHWVNHQMDVIVRRTRYRLRQAEEEAHILRGLLKALDALDEVIALIRRSPTADDARTGLMELLDIDEAQAQAILNMQLRRLAALERQKIQDRHDELMRLIAEYNAIIASEDRQREIISEELGEIVNRYGDERRTKILRGFDGDMSMEDLIPEEEMVVTITRGGYVKRTRSDQYRSQHRGGKGIRGAQLRGDDVVEHFFVTTTHNWILFFTNMGRVYRTKAYELLEAGRDAKGQHVANLLAFQPGETIAKVMELRSYEDAPYLVLATKGGLVKKTRLSDYDTNRTAGLIAINLREGDEVVSAFLISPNEDILLVSRQGMSLRFNANDEALRPMGRSTSGVTGMKFRDGDELISANVVTEDSFVFVVTEGGYAKRTSVNEYRVQGRNGYGIKVAKLVEDRGALVGALIVDEDDEVLVVMQGGKVVRTGVSEVPAKGRDTMGVIFAKPGKGDSIIGVARNQDRQLDEPDEADTDAPGGQSADPQVNENQDGQQAVTDTAEAHGGK